MFSIINLQQDGYYGYFCHKTSFTKLAVEQDWEMLVEEIFKCIFGFKWEDYFPACILVMFLVQV